MFAAMVERGNMKMLNVGHDHINDFCATLMGVRLCYGGGFGYVAYGRKGWPRRARVVDLSEDGSMISTHKVHSHTVPVDSSLHDWEQAPVNRSWRETPAICHQQYLLACYAHSYA